MSETPHNNKEQQKPSVSPEKLEQLQRIRDKALELENKLKSRKETKENVELPMYEESKEEEQKEVADKVVEDLLEFVKSDKPIERLGEAVLTVGQKDMLQRIRRGFRFELAAAQGNGAQKMSIRTFVYHKMRDTFEAYEMLIINAKLITVREESWNRLNEEQRKNFPTFEAQAVEVFNGMLKGEEFVDFTPTDAEKGLIEEVQTLSSATAVPSFQENTLNPIDRLVYRHLIQRIAFRLAYRSDLKDQDATASPMPELPKISSAFQEREQSWESVPRISDQEAVGDLNGSYESFFEHLKVRGLIEQKGADIEWVGGNKRVVFVGDILGDRSPTGLKVMEALVRLDGEARKQGGLVESLAGNHDNMLAAVLGGYTTEGGRSAENDERIYEYPGTLEGAWYADDAFKQYIIDAFKRSHANWVINLQELIDKKRRNIVFFKTNEPASPLIQIFEKGVMEAQADLDELNELYLNASPDDESRFMKSLKYLSHGESVRIGKALAGRREIMLSNMRKDDMGHKKLEAICSQKLVTCVDDTVYTHIFLTTPIVQKLLEGGSVRASVEKLNAAYQKGLRYYLLGEGKMTKDELKDFDELRTIFLSTGGITRINYTNDPETSAEEKEKMRDELKKQGINLAVHGHANEYGVIGGTDDLPIVSIDRGMYKREESYGRNAPTATITIDTKGNVKSTEAKQIVRERKA